MKKFILMMVIIINIIFAFSLFLKGGILIFVNSKNEDIVKEALDEEIENTDDITRIILGRGWDSGALTIYHSFGKNDRVYISQRGKYEELEKYIIQNGISLDKIGIELLIASVVISIYLMLYVALEIIIIKKILVLYLILNINHQ